MYFLYWLFDLAYSSSSNCSLRQVPSWWCGNASVALMFDEIIIAWLANGWERAYLINIPYDCASRFSETNVALWYLLVRFSQLTDWRAFFRLNRWQSSSWLLTCDICSIWQCDQATWWTSAHRSSDSSPFSHLRLVILQPYFNQQTPEELIKTRDSE